MFASTILLRRLFSTKPSQKEMDFHWWFVTCGIKDWHRFLASKGFPLGRRVNIIRRQEKVSRRALEVWDTNVFRGWDQTDIGRNIELEIIGADAMPHIMSAQQVWAGPTTGHGPAFQAHTRNLPAVIDDQPYH